MKGKLKGRFWLVARISLILMLFCLQIQANGFSQQTRVSLKLGNVSVRQLFIEIEKVTDLAFVYNSADVEKIGNVVVDFTNEEISKILDYCLNGTGFTYSFVNNHIVIKKAEKLIQQQPEERIITGKVMDKKTGAPLPGATIKIKGTMIGTVSDADGKFKFSVPGNIEILEVSFIGYEDVVVVVGKKEYIEVSMVTVNTKMDEVVVTGYLNVRKESFTGNAVTVNKNELLKVNNKNVISALQAFDPSFRLRENNIWGADPNALPEFNLRGESSIDIDKGLQAEKNRRTQRTNLKNNPNLPIFILDGFQVDVEKIYDMDINRIESMTILKDAAATAMYGSQAANGVVVVTTVAPKPGELQVSYTFSGGGDFPDLSDYNLCNATEMLEVERLANLYVAQNPAEQVWKDIEYEERMNNIKNGINTDWLSQPLRNVFNHAHSLNLQGGQESIRYSLDLNYGSNDGVMKGSYRNRIGAGISLDYRPKSWLQLLNSVTYNQTKSENSPYGNFSDYVKMKPYLPIYDADGNMLETLTVGTLSKTNPLYAVKYRDDFSGKGRHEDIMDNLKVNLYFGAGFQFKGQFSIRKLIGKVESFSDPRSASRYLPEEERGSLTQVRTNGYSWNTKAMLYYNSMLNEKHFINATLGMELSESKDETVSATFTGFGLSSAHSPLYAAQQPNKTDVSKERTRNIGYLGAVNYSYNDIYLLDMSFRFDASSIFGSEKQWAPFWSVGVGVNFHNYSFLENNRFISTLKLRGSYGSTGNVNFPPSMAATTYALNTDMWFFTGPTASLLALGNPSLTWEKTKTVDLGLVLGMFDERLSLNFSYYNKRTEGLIDNISIRHSSGFKSYAVNSGTIENKGIELNLNAILFRNESWMLTVNANLASNKNTIIKLGESAKTYNDKILAEWENVKNDNTYKDVLSSPVILYYEGASKSAIYAVRSAGIDPANGKERFIKKNGMSTYVWNANDQVVVGDKMPDAQGTLGLSVAYKGIYLTTSFMYQWGAQTYNETLLQKVENADIQNSNVDRRVLTQRWRKPGDLVTFYDLKNNTYTQVTSRFVQDYNYLNFTSLSVGYDFKNELISKWHLRNLGIRLNVNDICRWSTVKQERGISYPYTRSFSFTVNIGI